LTFEKSVQASSIFSGCRKFADKVMISGKIPLCSWGMERAERANDQFIFISTIVGADFQ
jgi:hypothetical protein